MSAISRSMEATAAGEAARAERGRRAMPSGWWGVILVAATETALFGSVLASYFYLRLRTDTWPPEGIPEPSVTLPLVLTGMLIASTIPMFAAARAARAGNRGRTWLAVASATAIQGVYLGLQIHLFVHDLHDFSPTDNAYGSIYFTMLGLHHAHVAVGLAIDAWLLGALAAGLTNYRLIAVRVAAIYWYFVAAVAVLVVLTQLYPSL